MSLNEKIKETLEKWKPEIKQCRDALIDSPISPPNVPYRLVVEMDYLLVEADKCIAQLKEQNERILEDLEGAFAEDEELRKDRKLLTDYLFNLESYVNVTKFREGWEALPDHLKDMIFPPPEEGEKT